MPKNANLATLSGLVQGSALASDQDLAFMREAIKVMRDAGVVNKTGGPFGAVIVKDGQVIAAAGNSVIQDNDPSAHAEVNAIRQACRTLDNWDLSGCVMYSSCLLYTSPSPRDMRRSRMPSSA